MLILLNSAKVLITGVVFILVSMSAEAATYYVAPASGSVPVGNDSNTGTSASSPWTITKGFSAALAGDVVNIKGGDYGHVHVTVANSGTISAPIIFQGYSGTPVLDGVDWLGDGIYMTGKSYITLKGLKVKNYNTGVILDRNCDYNTIDNVVADSCTNIDYVNKGYDGYGIQLKYSDYCVVKNCSATDNGGNNIQLFKSNYCTVQNCQAYSKQSADNKFATDYYIVIGWSSNNTVRDCYVEGIVGWGKGDHGFVIKDQTDVTGTHSTNNLFVNCTAKKFSECFCLSHESNNNVVDSCTADNTGKAGGFNTALMIRDGADNNTFKNCTAIGVTQVVAVYDGSVEGGSGQTQTGNNFTNCTFKTGVIGAFLRSSINTTFKNCNFVNIENLFRFSVTSLGGVDDNSGTVLRNCILSSVTKPYETVSRSNGWGLWTGSTYSNEAGYDDMANVSTTYTDFFNGFAALSGIGNISSNPYFASTTDYHLKSLYGRWNGTTWVNDDVTSPCINTGNTSDSYDNEPIETGGVGRIDMGRYGNTTEASKKYTTGNQAPIAVIDNITPNPVVQNNTVSFTGTGTDADGTIAAYEWSSSINGIFSTSEDPSYSALSVGTHTISFRVQDNVGDWSTATTETLVINGNQASIIADWGFNENEGAVAYDNSINANTGTLTNSPTRVSGKLGNALNFTDNYINIPSSTSLNTITSGITLCAWIKASANTARSTVIERWLYGTGVNQRSFNLYVDATGTIAFGLSNNGTASKWLSTTDTIIRDVWTYITATFDGTTMKIYLNGALNTSVAAGFSTIFVPTGDIHIGNWQTTATTWELPFKGAIDEVKIYDNALSISEIKTLYSLTESLDSIDIDPNKCSIKCYPNPFSSEITICYNVPKDGKVKVEIYNSNGQFISSVVDENQTAGEYSTVWNIESNNAGELANGLYFCKIVINGNTTTSKIMLLK
ncbi:MAG: right-handed parallel beta-helix repeat-containing protein [Bacteroidales bacterium]|nr:right-handed parallel beta-helix repeat-containing protein [Bacteroidales bacterium]